jgi:hypothetical protein
LIAGRITAAGQHPTGSGNVGEVTREEENVDEGDFDAFCDELRARGFRVVILRGQSKVVGLLRDVRANVHQAKRAKVHPRLSRF